MATFAERLELARLEPAYWSYRTTLQFVDAVVAEMDAQGVSGAEMARRMGTSRAWVSRVLAGECNLTLATMGKLAFALGLTVSTVLVPLTDAAGPKTAAASGTSHRSARARKSA